MNPDLFLCDNCDGELSFQNNDLICAPCKKNFGGIIDGDIVVFDGCTDKAGFFEVQAASRLSVQYKDYSREHYKESLKKLELYCMDLQNKKVGIEKKLWWEPHLGKIKNASILEVGCGVNYLVPYWLDCGNEVVAFDICKESVLSLKDLLKKIGLYTKKIQLFVCDARKLKINKKFDYICINNVMHHVDKKKETFKILREYLKDDGRIINVEPNYFYPFRWLVETDFLSSINIVKKYFVKHDLIEDGEKAITFSSYKKDIEGLGFNIEKNLYSYNSLGYAITYFLQEDTFLPKLIYWFDRNIISKLLPKKLSPFEYLILSKNKSRHLQ